LLGRELYEAFFKGYTTKQWGVSPTELAAEIIQRLPVRFNYDDNYYSKKYQGIPADGYTEVIRSILNHACITVLLNKQFGGQRTEVMRPITDFQSPVAESPSDPPPATSHPPQTDFVHVFYTGPLDSFFGCSEGRLGYRTVTFEQIQTEVYDYQGNAVINYPDMSVPWTRIHEHKHFTPWEKHQKTVAFREFSKETEAGDIPYYPKRLAADKTLLLRYRQLACELSQTSTLDTRHSTPSYSFLGRLATYRYMDMEAVIGEALEFADKFVDAIRKNSPLPIFPNNEE
jgi:UDP-galactopyranose mutase